MREFLAALAFLTVTPLPTKLAEALWSSRVAGRALAWYPFIGLLIGGLLAGGVWLLGWSGLGTGVQAGLLLLLWVGVTGGLHLDGVIDSCDALFASVGVARRLAILKDVHSGAFGGIGLFFVLGLKWALLAELLATGAIWPGLLLAPLWGRWMLVWAAQRFPYARSESSLGATMTAGLSRRELGIATLWAGLVQVGLGSWQPWLFFVLFAPLTGLLLARWAAGKLGGGLTGDIYGFLCELTEGFGLLCLAFLGGIDRI